MNDLRQPIPDTSFPKCSYGAYGREKKDKELHDHQGDVRVCQTVRSTQDQAASEPRVRWVRQNDTVDEPNITAHREPNVGTAQSAEHSRDPLISLPYRPCSDHHDDFCAEGRNRRQPRNRREYPTTVILRQPKD